MTMLDDSNMPAAGALLAPLADKPRLARRRLPRSARRGDRVRFVGKDGGLAPGPVGVEEVAATEPDPLSAAGRIDRRSQPQPAPACELGHQLAFAARLDARELSAR